MSWGPVARSQDGVITRGQLRAAGLSDDAVDRMLAGGGLTRLSAGVFLVRGAPLTYRARLSAAVCATGGVLGFGTAAHLWGIVDEAPRSVTVVHTTARHLRPIRGVTVKRSPVPPRHVTVRDGLPVTSRTWTLLDHLGELPFRAASDLADRALLRGWLSRTDLERRVTAYPRRRGNPSLRRLLAITADGAAAESERRLHSILRSAGLSGWVANHPIWHGGEIIAVADVAFPSAMLVLEVDGMAHHTAPDRFQRDRTRQNALVAAGWTVLRFTWRDVTQRPGYVRRTVERQLMGGARTANGAVNVTRMRREG